MRDAAWTHVATSDLTATLTASRVLLRDGSEIVGTSDTNTGDIAPLPGGTLPSGLGDMTVCAVCGTKRARSHLLVNVAGGDEVIAVGKACAAKRWGPLPRSIDASLLEPQALVDQRVAWINNSRHYPVVDILAAALVATSEHGYVTRKQAAMSGRYSTAQTMEQMLASEDSRIGDQLLYAEMLRLWVLEDSNTDTDFFRNARAASAMDAAPITVFGLLAAVPTAQKREIALREAETAGHNPEEPYKEEFHGQVGVRHVIPDVLIVRTKELPSGTTLVEMRTREGRKLTWFASNPQQVPEVGAVANVTATVKKHEVFRGQYSTIVNRCVLA